MSKSENSNTQMRKIAKKLVVASFVTVMGLSSLPQNFLGFKSNSIVAHAEESNATTTDDICDLTNVKSMYAALDRINASLKDSKYSDINFYDVYQVNNNALLSKLTGYTKVLNDLGIKVITEDELTIIVDLVNTYGDITSNTISPVKALKIVDAFPSSQGIDHLKPLVTKLSTVIRNNVVQEKPTQSLTTKLEDQLKGSNTPKDTKKLIASSSETLKYDVPVEYNEDIAFALSYPNNISTNEDILMALKDSTGQLVAVSSLVKIDGTDYQVLTTNVDPDQYVLEIYTLPTTDVSYQTLNLTTVKNVFGGYVSSVKVNTTLTGTITPVGGRLGHIYTSAEGEHLEQTILIKEPGSSIYVPFNSKVPSWNSDNRFSPTKLGTYSIKAIVKNTVSGHSASNTLSIKAVKNIIPSVKKITLNKTQYRPGEKIKIKTTASGIYLVYQYWFVDKYQGYKVKSYTSKNTATIKAPTRKGKYKLNVQVKQINGNFIYSEKAFTVK
ncbi:hypothetical protein [Rummeliibacillus pycnus]|uniref:hypothetical protein n=1 Tax=Rummeliibacillus pycnus TaxID=101070 RepID=UPI0037C9F9FD